MPCERQSESVGCTSRSGCGWPEQVPGILEEDARLDVEQAGQGDELCHPELTAPGHPVAQAVDVHPQLDGQVLEPAATGGGQGLDHPPDVPVDLLVADAVSHLPRVTS